MAISFTLSPRRLNRIGLLIAGLTALLLSGCANSTPPTRRPAVSTIEGRQEFLGGRILAELRIGPRSRPHQEAGKDGEIEEHGRPHRRHGGFQPGMGGPPSSRTDERDGGDGPVSGMRPARHPNQSPPLEIRLRFTNQSDQPVDVVVADFLSPLGNFVVQPERFTLQPRQSFDVEPMTSLIGDNFRDGNTSLTLQTGKTKETKVFELKLASGPQEQP